MYGRFHRQGRALAAILVAFSLGALPSAALADGSSDVDAARGRAGNLEDHQASSSDLEDRMAKSRDPDEMVAESETMEGREAEAKNPASMVVDSGELDRHQATSTNLTDLREAKPDAGFEAIEVPGQADWVPSTDPEVLVARKQLVQAQKRAEAARTAYGDAQERNYPRGEARIRIVNERDAAMKTLEGAKRALEAVE